MGLRKNQIVIFAGGPHRVAMVNDCRARLSPLTRHKVEFATLEKKREFEAGTRDVSISPESDIPTMRIVTEEAARAAGYRSLTHQYNYDEADELGRAWGQLAIGGIPAVAVFCKLGQRFTLWRKFEKES